MAKFIHLRSFTSVAALLWSGANFCCTPAPRPIRTVAEINEEAQVSVESPPASEGQTIPVGTVVSFASELSQVSGFRNLKADEEIRGLQVEVSELLAHVERSVDLETPAHALRGTEEMLVALGVVPLQFQYRATMVKLLRGQLAGLYDPHLKMMLIREDLGENERKMTLLHELVHALQDQNFDLDEVVEWSADDTDRSSALSAMAEGDATSAMFDGISPDGRTAISLEPGFIQNQMLRSSVEVEKRSDIPVLIHRSLRAPYLDGITFVHALRRRGGWDEVNRVWRSPPQTTEQLLHIEKYDQQEPARDVALPGPPPGEEWRLILHDIWGEQSLRLVFEQWLAPEVAAERASGWGGDRIVAYESGEHRAVAWHIEGDSPQIAKTMYDVFAQRIQLAQGDDFNKEELDEVQAGLSVRCGRINPTEDSPYLAVALRGDHLLVTSSSYSRDVQEMGSCEVAIGWVTTQASLLFQE